MYTELYVLMYLCTQSCWAAQFLKTDPFRLTGNIFHIYIYFVYDIYIYIVYDIYIYIYCVCSIIRDNVTYESFRVLDYL